MKNIIENIEDIVKKLGYILNRKQKIRYIKVLLVIIVGAAFETLGVSAILPFVQVMMKPEIVMENVYVKDLLLDLHIDSQITVITIIGLGVICIYIIKNVYLSFSILCQHRFQCKIEEELVVNGLKSYLKRSFAFFLNISSSELIQSVEGDIGGLYVMLGAGFKIITEILTTLMIGIFIFLQAPIMAFSIAILGMICTFGTIFGFKNLLKTNGLKERQYSIEKNKNLYAASNGIKEIKVMNREEYFIENYTDSYVNYQKTKLIKGVVSELPERIIEAVCIGGLIGIVCARILNGSDIEKLFPQLSAFAVAAFRILPSISRISSGFNTIVFSKPYLDAAYSNLIETERYKEEIKKYIKKSNQTTEKLVFNEKLELENVTWRYPNTEKNILENLSIVIEKGKSIAFIGMSGAGKTTLADVILGLLQPQSGMITLDGIDIFTAVKQWSSMVGYVPQSVFMADDTIRSNIAFGIPREQIDDKRVWRALDEAQLLEVVDSLPEKLDTEIGERGIRFSGGQRQRLAIARALYYNPEILVMDEATAALDTETETALMESIEKLHGKKTLIIIAHRLSTIEKCDTVYEIKDGKAVLKR